MIGPDEDNHGPSKCGLVSTWFCSIHAVIVHGQVGLIQQTERELEAQKELALQKLETQIDSISQLIKEKLLGKQVVL